MLFDIIEVWTLFVVILLILGYSSGGFDLKNAAMVAVALVPPFGRVFGVW